MNRSTRLLALELVAVALTNETALAQDGSVLTTLENQVVTAARGRQTTMMEAARSLFWILAGGRLQRRSGWSRRSSSPSWSSSSARTSTQPPARWCFPPTDLLSAPRWRRRSAPRAMRSVREGRGGEGGLARLRRRSRRRRGHGAALDRDPRPHPHPTRDRRPRRRARSRSTVETEGRGETCPRSI